MALQELHTGEHTTALALPAEHLAGIIAKYGHCAVQLAAEPLPYSGSLLGWLREQSGTYFYIKNPSDGSELLAMGCLLSYHSETLAAAPFYNRVMATGVAGGFALPVQLPFGYCYSKILADQQAGTWDDFATTEIIIPQQIALVKDGVLYSATYQLLDAANMTPQQVQPKPMLPCTTKIKPYAGEARRISGTDAAFMAEATAIKQAITQGTLQKGVAAKRSVFTFSSLPDPCGVLQNLIANEPGCTVYALHKGGSYFIGATPELLFSQQDSSLQSESIAGTIRRGETPEEDLALAQRLTENSKERLEQQMVTSFISDVLAPLSEEISISPKPGVKKLTKVQHLYSKVESRLRSGICYGDVLSALFPTPATCGTPRENAREAIRLLEGFDRGLYTGTLGWYSLNGYAEFLVAIRCGLLRGNTAEIFAGCGIVADSVPEHELAEAELKTKSIIDGWTCKA